MGGPKVFIVAVEVGNSGGGSTNFSESKRLMVQLKPDTDKSQLSVDGS